MPIDTLMTAAEIAVGIAGFTAIAIVLGRVDADSNRGRLDFFILFSVPFSALVLSLLPVTLSYLNVSPSPALRISSGVMLIVVIAWYVYIYTRPAVEPRAETPLTIGGGIIAVANALAQLANVLVLSTEWHFGVYFAGVVWLLAASVAVLFWAIQSGSAA